MKGVTMTQTAKLLREKWDQFCRPVAVGLDASRFDQHVSLEALKFEHTIYPECFRFAKDRGKLRELLKYQLVNKCSGYVPDGEVKYKIKGTRMSGDMNTSLGNCVLMCMMIKAYADYCGVKLQLANNGDDCVVFMEQSDLDKFSSNLNCWFLEMGFNMVVEPPSYEFEHIEFCQTKPVYDGKEWVMCRNPWTAIAKDSVLLKNPKQVNGAFFKQWLDAVGTGGLALAGGLPIFQSFYKMYQRSGQIMRRNWRGKLVQMDHNEILPWFMREEGLRGTRAEGEVSPEARASFYFAFGVTPDEQVLLEEYYDSMCISAQRGEWHPRDVFLTPL
nr:MAG: reverse transcriptase-like protein [Leptochloa chinensis tombus-like virus 1]